MMRQNKMPLSEEDITCGFTLNVCARLTVDAACCLPCCCGCGGCCGLVEPCVAGAFPDGELTEESGWDRFGETCFVQFVAGVLMPFTCCG